jgi:hypothetical protein
MAQVCHSRAFQSRNALGGGTIVLKKGGIARLDLDELSPPSGRLMWLTAPSFFVHPEASGDAPDAGSTL